MEGWIRSAPAGPLAGARVDLLALDGALQLCAFWARAPLGKSALPVGFAELRILAEIPCDAMLHCVAVLDQIAGNRFSGHMDLLDCNGRPLVQVRRARGQLL